MYGPGARSVGSGGGDRSTGGPRGWPGHTIEARFAPARCDELHENWVLIDLVDFAAQCGPGGRCRCGSTSSQASTTTYGPAGIGTGRGVDGFRRFHQSPFLVAMPDRRGGADEGSPHFFGDGDHVGVTVWPGMTMTLSGGVWLGIPPVDRAITMRSLDFWRIERRDLPDGTVDRKIRENWVLVDLLDVYGQLGVDVLARRRELVDGTRP